MSKYSKFLGIALSALFVFALAVPNIAYAQIIVDVTLDDVPSVTDDGNCSLREAVEAADTNTVVDTCDGTASDDINFNLAIGDDTITLDGSAIDIDTSLKINGPGADQLTISGNDNSGIFTISDGNNDTLIDVSVSGLALTEGFTSFNGGAIRTEDSLTIDSCYIFDNFATLAGGAIAVFDDSDSVDVEIVILNSTFQGNETNDSCGVITTAGADVAIQNSTLTENTAMIDGGALCGSTFGTNNGTYDILFTTLVGNSTGDEGGAIVNNVDATDVIRFRNSIVADNTATSGNNCFDNSTGGVALLDDGYNIEDEDTCDLVAGTSSPNTNPQLDSAGLQDNGGPTQTIALLITSPAVDEIPDGANTCNVDFAPFGPTPDQRGFPRFLDGNIDGTNGCDIGAFELQVVDLSIEKSDFPEPVTVNETLTYTLFVSNVGDTDATGVTVEDTLPADVAFDSASAGCAEAGGVVTCDIGDLGAGDPAVQIQIAVTAPADPGVLFNTAEVSADQNDPNTANNTSNETTNVVAEDAEEDDPQFLFDTTALEPGDENCPNGGIRIDFGTDTNDNGTLDEDEITDTNFVCNGEEGEEGPQGQQGPEGPEGPEGDDGDDDGCSLAGKTADKSSAMSFLIMLLPLFALAIRTARRKQ